MCGRFTLTYRRAELLAAELGVPIDSLIDYRPRFNIAPTDPHWIVRTRFEDREILPAKWGLVNYWMTDRKQAFKNVNARAETVRKLPTFRAAFAERRCVVPADGFFEWTGPKENRQPIWFHRNDGGLILFAGLYDSWRPSPSEKERTFTIITTGPNALLKPVHNRMPVILEENAVDDWLYARRSPDSLIELLRPAREDLLSRRQSRTGSTLSRTMIPTASKRLDEATLGKIIDGPTFICAGERKKSATLLRVRNRERHYVRACSASRE